MPNLALEFLVEDAFKSLIDSAVLGLTCYQGLTLADFAKDEAAGEGYFVACDEVSAVEDELGNGNAKVIVGVFTLRKRIGKTPAQQLATHRTNVHRIRDTVLRDDLTNQLNGIVNDFTAIGFVFNGFKTYRTNSHLVSVAELTLRCCGSTITP